MTQVEKELLIKELCAGLRYRPYINICDGKEWYTTIMEGIDLGDSDVCGTVTTKLAVFAYKPEYVKLYLRPMSSMTEEEDREWQFYKRRIAESCDESLEERIAELHDWFLRKNLDYRGLIPKGLALQAPEGMYSKKTCGNCPDKDFC